MENIREFLMTQEEQDKLKEQIDYLKNEKRKEIAEKINVARGYGDLSENSEYDAAKAEQAENEELLKDLEHRLKYSKVVSADASDGKTVNVGVTVRVKNMELKNEMTLSITGTIGADPMNGKISIESPIAKALIGNKVGATVVAETPTGPKKFKILEILK
ncbi:MAG: transcription elongation factor GreA [Ruminococcaceae bacterium]|nr:transcription elongation factor GreA [Oscillospiraceae bacterium]